jgi:DNA-binding NarL/FixJ family response regulator
VTARIFIADDHAIVLDGLRHILSLEPDFEIVGEALTGRETIAGVTKLDPDVLVLDLRLPDGDGLEVLRALKSSGSATRVVLLTAGIDEREVAEALRLGVAGVILKVMASRLLVQCIRKVHAGGHWIEKESFGKAIQRMLTAEDSMTRHSRILSSREIEVVRLIAQGLRNRQIAEQLSLSEATVKIHLHNIYSKRKLNSRLELSLYARDKGLG